MLDKITIKEAFRVDNGKEAMERARRDDGNKKLGSVNGSTMDKDKEPNSMIAASTNRALRIYGNKKKPPTIRQQRYQTIDSYSNQFTTGSNHAQFVTQTSNLGGGSKPRNSFKNLHSQNGRNVEANKT